VIDRDPTPGAGEDQRVSVIEAEHLVCPIA